MRKQQNSKVVQARSSTEPVSFSTIKNYLIDLLFPPRCAHCGRIDTPWCEQCQADLDTIPIKRIRAKAPPPLQAIASTGVHDGYLQALVQGLKYDNATIVAKPLAERIVKCILQENWQINGVASVPLHTVRLQERGYNQSNLLSIQVAELLGKPDYSNFIFRDRYTRSQVGLSREERLENVVDAFRAEPIVKDKRLLLVDDVFTTGATLRACAQALVASGANAVYGVTVTAAV